MSDDDLKLLLLQKVRAMYSLGKDFEPQRYFTTADAPWAAAVLLEWSTDGESSYHSTIFDANYNDLYMIALARLHIVEA